MKITFKQYLLEAKFSKPITAFHATKIENLKSILKNGLIPNKNLGWGSDVVQPDLLISLKSLPGVYFTLNPPEAIGTALEINFEKGLIVICDIQPKMGAMDEDDLDIHFRSFYKSIRNMVKKIKGIPYKISDADLMKEIETVKNSINYRSTFKGLSVEQLSILKRITESYIHSIIDHLVHVTEEEPKNNHYMEQKMRIYRDKITKLVFKSNETLIRSDRLRIPVNSPIGYSGTNRIIGILSYKHDTEKRLLQTTCHYGDCSVMDDAVKEYNDASML